MKNRNFISVIVLILSVSIILTGFYSYRPTTKEQLKSKPTGNTLKLLLNDEREILVNEEDEVNISNPDTIVITRRDSTKYSISYKDVINMYEERFDFGKTFFAGFWTLFLLIAVLGLFIGNSLKMG